MFSWWIEGDVAANGVTADPSHSRGGPKGRAGRGVVIGPGAVVGPQVIGENTRIGPRQRMVG